MLGGVVVIGLIILIVWTGVLTYFYLKLQNHYLQLTSGIEKKDLHSILEQAVKEARLAQKDVAHLFERCDKIEKDNLSHMQKIGLLRFNPFKDTGGDQSFILALVDQQHTGVVISGLYSRSGTRWYAKRVVKGKSVEHELSDEEKKALAKAE